MRKIESKKLIHDGSDTEIYDLALVSDGKFIMKLKGILNNNFSDIKKTLNEDQINHIIQESDFNDTTFAKYFNQEFDQRLVSDEELDLYFYKTSDKIYVFSFGEKQPSRYLLYLEGVWEL
jgi:hypothetical protein